MALTFEKIEINGVERDAVVIEGVGDSAKVVFKSSLSPFDIEQFEAVDASTGANFKAKFESFVLPNGRTAASTYAPAVKTVGEFNLAARITAAGRIGAREIIELQDAAVGE